MIDPIDWSRVILTIRRKYRWPRKIIAEKVGVAEISIYNWQSGKHEPRYSQGAMLLKLANE
jgi:hypothetical protein